MKKILLAAAASVVLSSGALAADPAFDDASTNNYPGGAWATGDNGGFGFGAWTITTNAPAGSFIGDTALSDPSFGIFSEGAGSITAYRPFTGGALLSGESFNVSLANTATIDGEIGLSLMEGATARWTLKFVGGGSAWQLNDGGGDFGSGQDYAANTALAFSFTYNGGSSYSYTFGTGSGDNFNASADISNIDGVQFFSVNQGAGQNMGFNNLEVVPEPSTYALLALSAAAMGGYVIRRRRR